MLAVPKMDMVSAFFIALFIMLCSLVLARRNVVSISYPPGPSPTFLIGNPGDMPRKKPWLAYKKLANTYGDIIHFTLFGAHIVILNSIDDVRELFEKRSRLYSSRPYIPIFSMMGWANGTATIPYGSALRKHRYFMQQTITKHNSLVALQPMITMKVRELLHSLLTSPHNFIKHQKAFSASVVMAVIYGYKVTGEDDPFVSIAEQAMEKVTEATLPGVAIVNVLPILRFVPAWFPGGHIKRLAVSGKKLADQMRNVPFASVKKQVVEGSATSSIASTFLKQYQSPEDEFLLKEACAALYGAGVDTTAAVLTTFFHAMLEYPKVQSKAQKEIDSIIGASGRLPTFEDRPSLPYSDALLRELLRWRPVLPLGLPHTTTEDDIYKGYHIPKGTTIFANIWAICHNEVLYAEPETVSPERFLDDEGKLKEDSHNIYAFGFGRRICAGRHLAMNSLWLSMVSILATFDIQPPKDVAGGPVVPTVEYSDTLISRASDFSCSVTPRSSTHRGETWESS